MKYVALTGGLYSGKTTLARALERKGYLLVNFTDSLKALTAVAVNQVYSLMQIDAYLSVEKINADKERYRGLLQQMGEVIDFTSNPAYILHALATWNLVGRPPAIFDNVRSDQQARTLIDLGFQVVRLNISQHSQVVRARRLGVEWEKVEELLSHPIERGISPELVALELDARDPIDELVRMIEGYDMYEMQRRSA